MADPISVAGTYVTASANGETTHGVQMIALAQDVTTANALPILFQYGALGAITLCALAAVRVLFQREAKSLDLERQRADRLEEELRQLNVSVHEKYVPTLTHAAEVLTRATEALALLRAKDWS